MLRLLRKLKELSDSVLKTDPLYIKNETDRIVYDLKNKILFYFLLSVAIITLIHINIRNQEHLSKVTLYCTIFSLTSFLIFARRNPPYAYSAMCCSIFVTSFLHYYVNPEELGMYFNSIVINPVMIMYISGYKLLPFLSLLTEGFLLKNFYMPFIDTDKGWAYIREHFFEAMVSNSFLILLMMYALDDKVSTYQIALNQRNLEKVELEKQRIFVLSFSHEIRNLINSLIGSLQICLIEADINSKIMSYLNEAKICTEILLHLMNNVLDSGKIIVNDLEITNSKAMIYENLRDTWILCSELLKKRWLGGLIKISHTLPEQMIIDKYRISQILLNLVGNASKFTERGKVEVTIDFIQKPMVEECDFLPNPYDEVEDEEGIYAKSSNFLYCDEKFSIFQLGQKVRAIDSLSPPGPGILKITVSDTGKGIESENIPKLFKQFSQLSTGQTRQLGTGLGLYITKNLCQGMKGDIRVYSKVNVGTTFVVCIMAEAVDTLSLYVARSYAPVVKKSEINALVVDDEPLARNVLQNFLRRIKVKSVVEANSGIEAVAKFKEQYERGNPITLITMDINMPLCDGKMAASLIRDYEKQMKLDPCIILMISGNCTHSEINECMDKNGNIKAEAFLKKPVSFDEIHKIIEKRYLHC